MKNYVPAFIGLIVTALENILKLISVMVWLLAMCKMVQPVVLWVNLSTIFQIKLFTKYSHFMVDEHGTKPYCWKAWTYLTVDLRNIVDETEFTCLCHHPHWLRGILTARRMSTFLKSQTFPQKLHSLNAVCSFLIISSLWVWLMILYTHHSSELNQVAHL